MMRRIPYIIIIFLILFASILYSQKVLKREVRAVWLTTAAALDFPQSSNSVYQKIELNNIVETLKNANFNTIVFQASPRGDAYYKSRILPWAEYLTGNLGQDPQYDPLAYLIDIAHAKGMEVHAWINAFKTYSSPNPPIITNPRHLIIDSLGNWNVKLFAKDRYGVWQTTEGIFLDPGNPEVRKHVTNVAVEVAKNYDIDGIHFDFIRYNSNFIYGDASNKYSVAYTDSVNGNPDMLQRDIWQRYQVEKVLKAIHDSLQSINPRIKLGVTPPGIYQGYRFGSLIGSAYMDIYRDCFIDPRAWLQKGIIDYAAPQIYWSSTSSYPFTLLAADWNANRYDRHIWMGMAQYRINEAGFGPFSEIESQIDFTRYMESAGCIFFRYMSLKSDFGIDYTVVLKNNKFRTIANIPLMNWKDTIPPNPPLNLKVEKRYSGIYKLTWEQPLKARDGEQAFSYNIYRVNGKTQKLDINNFYNIIANVGASALSYTDMVPDSTNVYTYAVTAFDRTSNESISSSNIVTGINDRVSFRTDLFKLEQNYPNPFNSETVIELNLGAEARVDLVIYNTLGQELKNIFSGSLMNGIHQFRWNGTDNAGKSLASGVYYSRLIINLKSAESKTVILNKSMVLMK